jgi:hypothetical protein
MVESIRIATVSAEALPPSQRDIGDDETLLRHVHWRQTDSEGHLTSAAFNDREMSVDRELLRSEESIRREKPQHGVARLRAGGCRAGGAAVEPAPLPTNAAHALVLFSVPGSAALLRFAREMKREASITWNAEGYVAARRLAETSSRAPADDR